MKAILPFLAQLGSECMNECRLHFLGVYTKIFADHTIRIKNAPNRTCATFKSTLPNQNSHVINAPFRNNYEAQRRVGVGTYV